MRDRGVNARLVWCLNSVLNVKALVGAFNQEKALVGAFSVITNLRMDPVWTPGHQQVQLLYNVTFEVRCLARNHGALCSFTTKLSKKQGQKAVCHCASRDTIIQ